MMIYESEIRYVHDITSHEKVVLGQQMDQSKCERNMIKYIPV